jgi:hypothetical protein
VAGLCGGTSAPADTWAPFEYSEEDRAELLLVRVHSLQRERAGSEVAGHRSILGEILQCRDEAMPPHRGTR